MFTVDHKTEQYLRSVMGVNVEYREDVKYEELASGWFVKNLGRPQGQAIVTPAVETYQHMMEDGSAAPAPILRDAPSGFGVLDGIQRLTANERTGATKFAAYNRLELLVFKTRTCDPCRQWTAAYNNPFTGLKVNINRAYRMDTTVDDEPAPVPVSRQDSEPTKPREVDDIIRYLKDKETDSAAVNQAVESLEGLVARMEVQPDGSTEETFWKDGVRLAKAGRLSVNVLGGPAVARGIEDYVARRTAAEHGQTLGEQ